MMKLNGWKACCAILVIGLITAASAQTFNTLVYFDVANGSNPWAAPVQGRDGNFYGTTDTGGSNSNGCGGSGCGTVFEITPGGDLTTLYSFCFPTNCNTGAGPEAGLILATDGNFYSTTANGGSQNHGEVFRITPTGSLTELSFIGYRGHTPSAPVVQGIDGNLYGTTQLGGTNRLGNVIKVSPPGIVADLYDFCSQPSCADGSGPGKGLIQASDGNFYGTTEGGGTGGYCIPGGCGTTFKITPKGVLTTLYSFCSQPDCADGAYPGGPLVQGTDGKFYGTANLGGAQGEGTVFRINSQGVLETLYSFCSLPNCADGATASSGLVQATDGNFYGTTGQGANNACPFGCGTIYEITPTGMLTTLHSFDGTDGGEPAGGLLQGTNGTFYGTTIYGGTPCAGYGCGTVYSLSVGLGPFVAFVQRAGTVGRTAQILGQGFTGTTSVSFNGISAKFTIQSDTYLTAKVPAGATTGYVTVTTPSGVLTSNVQFQVIP
jgi:uncharacterized repeat protein (TIGR03803 family)